MFQNAAGVQADKIYTVTDNVMKKLCGLENTEGTSVQAYASLCFLCTSPLTSGQGQLSTTDIALRTLCRA